MSKIVPLRVRFFLCELLYLIELSPVLVVTSKLILQGQLSLMRSSDQLLTVRKT